MGHVKPQFSRDLPPTAPGRRARARPPMSECKRRRSNLIKLTPRLSRIRSDAVPRTVRCIRCTFSVVRASTEVGAGHANFQRCVWHSDIPPNGSGRRTPAAALTRQPPDQVP